MCCSTFPRWAEQWRRSEVCHDRSYHLSSQAIVLLSSCLQPGRHVDLQLHALEGCITVITCVDRRSTPASIRLTDPQVAGDARPASAVHAGQPDHGRAAGLHAGRGACAGCHQGCHGRRGAAGQTRVRRRLLTVSLSSISRVKALHAAHAGRCCVGNWRTCRPCRSTSAPQPRSTPCSPAPGVPSARSSRLPTWWSSSSTTRCSCAVQRCRTSTHGWRHTVSGPRRWSTTAWRAVNSRAQPRRMGSGCCQAWWLPCCAAVTRRVVGCRWRGRRSSGVRSAWGFWGRSIPVRVATVA